MRIFIKNSMLAIFLSCCLFWATSAESKVCFAGDGDCGGIETFGGYQDPTNDIATQCAKAGYETLRSSCLPANGQQVTDYCPYDSNYVKCCSLDYQYDSCPHPMVQVAKCGNKYKCACNTSLYPYAQNGSRKCPDNARVDGASCAQVGYNSTAKQTTTELFFSDCICDTGLYPYSEDQCAVETTKGTVCKSRNNKGEILETRYSACYCDTSAYPETERSCFPYTGNMLSGTCKSGDTTRYKACNNCSGYPARTLEHVRYNARAIFDPRRCIYDSEKRIYYKTTTAGRVVVNVSECDYLECPYVQERGTEKSGYFKILQCHEPGYEPAADGSYCKPITCSKAVKQFIAKNPSYALFDGSQLVDGNGKATDKATYAIVADNITASTNCKGTSTSTSRCLTWKCISKYSDTASCKIVQDTTGKPICPSQTITVNAANAKSKELADIERPVIHFPVDPVLPIDPIKPIVIPQVACCQSSYNITSMTYGEGLGCSAATTYYSIPYLMNDLSKADDEVKALTVACTTTPTITVNSSTFPYKEGTKKLTFNGLNLKLNNSSTVIGREMEIVNGDITGNSVIINAKTTLKTNTGKPNNKPQVNVSSLRLRQQMDSSGYSFNATTAIQVSVPSSFKDTVMATFSFNGGEIFSTPKLEIYPLNTGDQQVNYNTTVQFKGPDGYTTTNAYGNLYIGTNSAFTATSRSMFVRMSGNFVWNLYKGSTLYNIYLSGNSQVSSTDYGTGNYSKIRRNNNSANDWGYCLMPWGQGFTIERVGSDSHRTYDEYNIICSINTSATRSLNKAISWKGSYSAGAAHGCSSSITSYCTNLDSGKCDEDRDYVLIQCGAGKL